MTEFSAAPVLSSEPEDRTLSNEPDVLNGLIQSALGEKPSVEVMQLLDLVDRELSAGGRLPRSPTPADAPPPRTVEPPPAGPRPEPAFDDLTTRGTERRRRWPVKWRHAAVMLARGVGVTAVAQEYDVCESVILRNLRRSARFRQWVREAEAAVEADAARHAAWLRFRAAASLANRAERDDPKTLDPLVRQIADLARDRIENTAQTAPDSAYARLSGFTKRDFR